MSRPVISRDVAVAIECSPDDVAQLFWHMDGDEQAMFFNAVAMFADDRLPFQMQWVRDSAALTSRGRMTMECIGEYGRAASDDAVKARTP